MRKVHAQLVREGGVDEGGVDEGGVDGEPVSRRQVERLMRQAGLQGARRGRKFTTTKADPAATRGP